MSDFAHYLDPRIPLEQHLVSAFEELRMAPEQRQALIGFLAPLKVKSRQTYEHSLRVGLLARRIARFMHLDERALLYAGLMHDVGKALTPLDTLHKTVGWSAKDTAAMRPHVMDSYRLLRGLFDFSAEIVVWHHRFQQDGYPQHIPAPLHEYSQGTQVQVAYYGRLLALADSYDALHRINSKFGDPAALPGKEIKDKMVQFNPDQKILVAELYNAGIFTTHIIGQEPTVDQPVSVHEGLYEKIWNIWTECRTPTETARHVMLATALEPFSDKSGCTTRQRNLNEWQRLEYFITAAINIGEAFHALADYVRFFEKAEGIYKFGLRAQQESKRNRRGGRVNQGIIEMLVPIVAAQHLYDEGRTLDIPAILAHAKDVMQKTAGEDVQCLLAMKRFAFDLSGYLDRKVPEYPNTENVFQYYENDVAACAKPTGIAYNGEFVQGFPTVALICETIKKSDSPGLNTKVEEAYQRAARMHGPDVAGGFLADCIATGMYLVLSHNPKAKFVS